MVIPLHTLALRLRDNATLFGLSKFKLVAFKKLQYDVPKEIYRR